MATNEATLHSQHVDERILRTISSTLAMIPVAAVAFLLFFAWDTSQTFGAWPTFNGPDPKDANGLLYALTLITGLIALPAAITLSVALPVIRRFRLHKLDVAMILTAVIGSLALVYLFSGDLGTWFVD